MTKNDPGKFDCHAAAEPNEPLFVLLGRDAQAPNLIRQWALFRERLGEDPEKVQNARLIATRMEAFRERRQFARDAEAFEAAAAALKRHPHMGGSAEQRRYLEEVARIFRAKLEPPYVPNIGGGKGGEHEECCQ